MTIVTVHPRCTGSFAFLTLSETEPVIVTGLGVTSQTAVCHDCGQRVLVVHGQMLEHRLPVREVEITSVVDEPVVIDHRTLRERLRGRVA